MLNILKVLSGNQASRERSYNIGKYKFLQDFKLFHGYLSFEMQLSQDVVRNIDYVP